MAANGRRFALMNICSDDRQRSHFVSIIAAAATVRVANREIAACLRSGSGVVKNLGIYTCVYIAGGARNDTSVYYCRSNQLYTAWVRDLGYPIQARGTAGCGDTRNTSV
jgi:hypothetical protein